MVVVGIAPKLPRIQRIVPSAVTSTPLAGAPSMTGEFVNCDSQPTESDEIWQRVRPDLVSM